MHETIDLRVASERDELAHVRREQRLAPVQRVPQRFEVRQRTIPGILDVFGVDRPMRCKRGQRSGIQHHRAAKPVQQLQHAVSKRRRGASEPGADHPRIGPESE